MAEKPTPKCKKHPERPAKMRSDGISTGCCEECLKNRSKSRRPTGQ